jgi:hypothetical protein
MFIYQLLHVWHSTAADLYVVAAHDVFELVPFWEACL